MITLITLHMLSPDNYDQAIGVLTKNTELGRKAQGFVTRKVLIDVENRLRGYSMTTWRSKEVMDKFLQSPERPPLEFEGEDMRVYEKTPSGRVLVFTHVDTDSFETDAEATSATVENPLSWTGRLAQISLHLLHEENRERGLDVLRRNTPIAAGQPGFVSRQVYVCGYRPLKSYSVATWETREALEAFRSAPGRPVIVHGDDGMTYEKSGETLTPVFPMVQSGVYQTIDEA